MAVILGLVFSISLIDLPAPKKEIEKIIPNENFKTLKLLNKKNLSIIIISLLSTFSTIAEDKPVDIWNIDKKEVETSIKENIAEEKINEISENGIYQMQADKNIDSIKLDQTLTSKEIKIAGLYDPEDHRLNKIRSNTHIKRN